MILNTLVTLMTILQTLSPLHFSTEVLTPIQAEYPLSDLTLNDSTFLRVLHFYDIPCPYIVLQQAKLESGNFTSELCIAYNNPLGLYDCTNHRYKRFNSWIEAVLFYKNNISDKYTGGNYYKFLRQLGYAKDPEYIDKLKEI